MSPSPATHARPAGPHHLASNIILRWIDGLLSQRFSDVTVALYTPNKNIENLSKQINDGFAIQGTWSSSIDYDVNSLVPGNLPRGLPIFSKCLQR